MYVQTVYAALTWSLISGNMFTHEKIKQIEVDVIDACGLRCPVCSRNDKKTLNNLKSSSKFLPLDDNIYIFNRFPNLKCVSFVGTRSESTLYPHLIEFVKYLKSRDIKIIISTNGNSRDEDWWCELGRVLQGDDEIRFAIDGSTQEIYSHYRIGGKLKNVLSHHKSLRSCSKCKTTLQFIKFKYNSHDLDNIKRLKIKHQFDNLLIGHGSYTFDGRQQAQKNEFVNDDFEMSDYHPPEEIYNKYKLIESVYGKSKKASIECTSYKNDELFINHLGKYSICCFHNGELLRNNVHGGDMNFVNDEHQQKVLKNKYMFCLTNCNKICKSMITDLEYL